MIRRTALALLLALALMATACASGGSPQAEGPSAVALTPTTEAPSVASDSVSGDPTSEGIRVHGHWTIEVLNGDGSVDAHHQFQNALTPKGAEYLVWTLSGEEDVLGWSIRLGPVVGSATPEVQVFPDGSSSLLLSMSGEVPDEFTIDEVATRFTGLSHDVTVRTLDVPVVVRANQTVYVEVEISFS